MKFKAYEACWCNVLYEQIHQFVKRIWAPINIQEFQTGDFVFNLKLKHFLQLRSHGIFIPIIFLILIKEIIVVYNNFPLYSDWFRVDH